MATPKILLSTLDNLEGCTISHHHGLVHHTFELRYEDDMDDGIRAATGKLREIARKKGANAVIRVRIDTKSYKTEDRSDFSRKTTARSFQITASGDVVTVEAYSGSRPTFS